MGILSHRDRSVMLSGRTTAGRDPSAALRLNGRRVSGVHALLTWNGVCWLIRDLGSSNGTLVDGHRLPPGVDRHLQLGAQLTFGETQEEWTLTDATAPVAIAEALDGSQTIASHRGVLALPDDQQVHATLLERADGRWVVELPEGERTVSDGDEVCLPTSSWRIRLPCTSAVTPRSEADEGEAFALAFRVGADEEALELHVVQAGVQVRIAPRASHYVLLTLARARLTDHAAGFPSVQAGWRSVDQLCGSLQLDELHLNVHVFRLRRQLAEHGIPGTIIERRPGEGLLRVGCSRLVVQPG